MESELAYIRMKWAAFSNINTLNPDIPHHIYIYNSLSHSLASRSTDIHPQEMNVFIGNSISFLCPFWVCGIFGFPYYTLIVCFFSKFIRDLRLTSQSLRQNLIWQFKDVVSKLFQYSLNPHAEWVIRKLAFG